MERHGPAGSFFTFQFLASRTEFTRRAALLGNGPIQLEGPLVVRYNGSGNVDPSGRQRSKRRDPHARHVAAENQGPELVRGMKRPSGARPRRISLRVAGVPVQLIPRPITHKVCRPTRANFRRAFETQGREGNCDLGSPGGGNQVRIILQVV